jgi:hypothetical protein
MLPTFPKAQKILDEAWNKRMFAVKNEVFPLHMHPPVQPIVEGKDGDFQRDDGQVKPLKIERHQVTTQYQFKDGKGMSLDDFYGKAKEVGEGLGKQMWQMMTGVVDEAVKETGNEIKIKKGDLKKEDILRMLEMGTENFDEAGNPTRQLVCGLEFGEELKKRAAEWSADGEFMANVAEIRRRKKAEFDEREACRRLVS